MSRGLPDDLTVEMYMEHYMTRALNRHAERLEGIDCLLEFDIRGDGGGAWALLVKDRQAVIERRPAPDARVSIEATATDWLDLVRGRLNGPLAFMTGKFKITGDTFYAMKLGGLLMGALSDLKSKT